MPEWKCEECGNTVEAPQRPDQCPCGSENVSQVEKEGLVARVKSALGM